MRGPYREAGRERGSFVLFFKNVGTNRDPLFKRPDILLWDEDGRPLEFWRHGVHMAPVDWDADGKLELVTGADLGAAVEALLGGDPISSDQHPSIGCNIKWRAGNEPDYFG